MSGLGWLLWLVLGAAVMIISMWHYRRRETPGRGRMLLAALRGMSLALVLLLLFDPDLPARDAAGVRGTQVLLDASLSMRLPGESGGTRWNEAVAEARARAGDRPILLFGDGARPIQGDALPDSAPGDARTRLLPGIQAAAEAGVRRVVVLTDGGIEDADAVARWAPRLGIEIEPVFLGADIPNISLAEVSAPQWVDAGEAVPLEFAVAGARSDSTGVVVRRDGRVIARASVPAAAEGRLSTGRMELRLDPAEEGGGWVRLEVALEKGDSVSGDDQRTVYVQVGEEPAGVALVSFQPDWEPRFLAPVLEQSLGLPLRAYLRSATGQYVQLGAGLEAGSAAAEAEVRGAVERGQLVVLHGLGVDAPAWAHEAAAGAPHMLVFPAHETLDLGLPITIGAALQGDFFPSEPVPPSPIAALLADVDLSGVTPLASMRPVDVPADAWAPLMATRGRQGAVFPLAVAGETGGRRWAIATGTGYWQWAFRGGAEGRLYARFWSALAGWLVRERSVAALPAVRPAAMAVPRGRVVPWVAQGVTDSMHIIVAGAGGAAVIDTVVAAVGGDTAFTRAPEPGHFSYRARAFADGNVTEGAGVLTVERYSPELARARIDPARLRSDATTVRGGEEAGPRGAPIHATAYPYVLLVLLLAAEWILRRRWGLR